MTSQWLFVQWVAWGASSSGFSESAGVFRYLKVARYMRLLRVAKCEAMVSQLLFRINSLTLMLVVNMAS